MRRAAELEYAPAQAWMASGRVSGVDTADKVVWVEKAAAQGDRDALYRLDCLSQLGLGSSQDAGKSLQCFREAAELGHAVAMYDYCKRAFAAEDWQLYRWMGRSAARGYEWAANHLWDAAGLLLKEIVELT